MQPHIQQTIADLRGRAALIEQAITILQTLDGLNGELRATLLPCAPPGPGRVRECGTRVPKPRVAASRQVEAKPSGIRVVSAAYLAAARELGDEFEAKALADAMRYPLPQVRLVLYRWEAKGWIERRGKGLWRKALIFPAVRDPLRGPGEAPAAEAPPAPDRGGKSADGKAELQAKLEEALKLRDQHRGAGREKMAMIFQRKADKLQAALDS